MTRETKTTEPPLLGRWHHGSGHLVCGTLRVASETFDTNPCDEFKDEMFDWMCDALNQAIELHRETGLTPRELADKVQFLSSENETLRIHQGASLAAMEMSDRVKLLEGEQAEVLEAVQAAMRIESLWCPNIAFVNDEETSALMAMKRRFESLIAKLEGTQGE